MARVSWGLSSLVTCPGHLQTQHPEHIPSNTRFPTTLNLAPSYPSLPAPPCLATFPQRGLRHSAPRTTLRRRTVHRATPLYPARASASLHSGPAAGVDGGSGEGEGLVRVDVLIVGGGVAGLASALALQRVGLRPLVVERSPGPREGGAALSLWGNAWRALDALGVGPTLRRDYRPLQGLEILDSAGRTLRAFSLDECGTGLQGRPHEVRGVQRAHLLRVLLEALPPGVVHYSTEVGSFQEVGGSEVLVELKPGIGSLSGRKVVAQALIGCDGAKSQLAKLLGIPPVQYLGYVAARGLASLDASNPEHASLAASLQAASGGVGERHERPEGATGGRIRMLLGRGVRAGVYPLTPSLFYWFTCANYTPPNPSGPLNEELGADKEEQKQAALGTVRGWRGGIRTIIEATPAQDISTYPITDRWDFNALLGGRQGKGLVSLAGDAAHPMSPNLGQGACTALEDTVVLAQCLSEASVLEEGGPGRGARTLKARGAEVAKALERFEQARARRVAPIVVRSNLMGAALQLDNPVVCAFRDTVVLPFVFTPTHFLDHALFDCGELPLAEAPTAALL